MFRLAERDEGLTRKVLALETGIPEATLKSYARGVEMPASALRKLARCVPLHLLSLLLGGTGAHLAPDEDGEGDVDALARQGLEMASEVAAARDPKGPGGSTVIPMERARIQDAARRFAGTARAVAA